MQVNSPTATLANDKQRTADEVAQALKLQAEKQRRVTGSTRANVAQDSDLDFLFMLASISIYHDLSFMWVHRRALLTFSYTPEGVSLDRLWVPCRYRHNGCGRKALTEFLQFFRQRGIPVYITVAPLDEATKPEKLIAFYTDIGFRPTGYINAIKLPEMIYGSPITTPTAAPTSEHSNQ